MVYVSGGAFLSLLITRVGRSNIERPIRDLMSFERVVVSVKCEARVVQSKRR